MQSLLSHPNPSKPMQMSGKTAIVGATLIDGTGADPVTDSVILVNGSKVEAVGQLDTLKPPAGYKVVDAEGRWLLPGLIDLHVHLFHEGYVPYPVKGSMTAYAGVVAANNLRSSLQSGITTLRGVCDGDHLDIAMRSAVERGQIIGPRLFVAGKGICMTGGHGSGLPGVMHEVDTPWDVRKAVRSEVKAGVDLIKLLTSHRTDQPEFSLEEIMAGVDEAHRLGRKVAIHAANFVSVRMAAEAGVDTIEHGSHVDSESADMMAEKSIIIVPTLFVKNDIPERIEKSREEGGNLWNLDPRDLDETYEWFTRCVRQLPKTIKLMRSKGVRIGAGTDNVLPENPFVLLPEEMEWMTRYGMSNMEAITSATRVGAEAIGAEDRFGTVEQGKLADMIMVDRDPLEDITAFKEVKWVMKEGSVIPIHPEWRRRPIRDPQSL